MMYPLRRHLLLAAALCFCAAALRADFEAGLRAYNAGDYATALKEWQPLADQGASHVAYNLGLMYARGQGVTKDFTKAAEYYKKAAEQGVVEAEYNLGVLYSNGEGVPKDEAEAMKWFLKAAQQGDTRAAESLGDIYNEGPGAFQNYTEAEKWYQKAAEAGVASAQFNLGVMYDIGQGVPQDFAEALKWYQKAAEQGDGGALCNIAILYYNGQGVPVDRVEAHRYFLLSKERGDPRATNLIQLTTEKLNQKQIAKAMQEADQWRAAHPLKQNGEAEPVLASTTPAQSRPAPFPHTDERMATGSGQASPGAPNGAVPTALPMRPEKAIWTGVSHVIAVGDVHGDYEQLVRVLRSAALIDQNTNWIGGQTHLVQTGDILDRGGHSRQVMDLLMKLQQQAEAAGGHIHVLLGNHEVMNIYGDLRYVSPGDFASFATPDSAKLRDREYDNFVKAAGAAANVTREQWNEQHPLGYFEQRAAFSTDGVYGKWLRSLNTAIRIDDTLFDHAGLSAKYASTSIDELNRRVREEINDPTKLQGGIVTDQQGPFWYRGLAKGDEKQLAGVVDVTLSNDEAKREVIAHSYADAAITPRFGGKVLMIDIGLPRVYDNISKIGCLEIENGEPYALHRGHRLVLPKDENGPDMLRYLKAAAALDPAPSPLESRIAKLENANPGKTPDTSAK
jgi:TPR repeat protein